ncbi:unnamed protein product [Meloidogyne enterolobii]|uniref:Uncharacterized protein n=2 Tax=Meloidogyne enterolobii TaxID=390850 RepID=A0ACB0Y6L2_MELEN
MSNMLFLCRLTENHPPIKNEPDKVLLRVYFNPETESHLVAESVIFTLFSERHLGPKLYGIFSGGRLEEYIPPDYICDALDRWLNQLRLTPSGSSDFIMPQKYLEWAPEKISCDDLLHEIENLRSLIVHSQSLVTFCHNDLQEGNILLPKGSSGNIRLQSSTEVYGDGGQSNSLSAFNPMDLRLVLIDFEYASYNYRGFDFANHFVEYSINYDVDHAPFYEILPERFPTEEQMLEFMYSYEREANPKVSEEQLHERGKKMIKETVPFVPVSHLLWGVWGLLQMEVSPVGFGFSEYGRDRLGYYYMNKHLLDKFLDKIY